VPQGKIEMTLSIGEKAVDHFGDKEAGNHNSSDGSINLKPSDVSVVAIVERAIGDNSLSNLITPTAANGSSSSRISKKAKAKPEVELGDSRKLAVVETSLSGLLHPCDMIPADNGEDGGDNDVTEDETRKAKSKGKQKTSESSKIKDWTKAERVAAEVNRSTRATRYYSDTIRVVSNM